MNVVAILLFVLSILSFVPLFLYFLNGDGKAVSDFDSTIKPPLFETTTRHEFSILPTLWEGQYWTGFFQYCFHIYSSLSVFLRFINPMLGFCLYYIIFIFLLMWSSSIFTASFLSFYEFLSLYYLQHEVYINLYKDTILASPRWYLLLWYSLQFFSFSLALKFSISMFFFSFLFDLSPPPLSCNYLFNCTLTASHFLSHHDRIHSRYFLSMWQYWEVATPFYITFIFCFIYLHFLSSLKLALQHSFPSPPDSSCY